MVEVLTVVGVDGGKGVWVTVLVGAGVDVDVSRVSFVMAGPAVIATEVSVGVSLSVAVAVDSE